MNDPQRRPHQSVYAEQLGRGFRWLRFAEPLETAFRDQWSAQYIPRLRVNILMGILIYSGYVIIDFLLLPRSAALWSIAVRLFVVTPPVLITLALTYRAISRQVLTAAVMGCMIAAGWGIVGLAAIVSTYGIPVQFGGLALMAMYIYFMSGLLFYQAAMCGLAVLAAMIVAGFAVDLPLLFFVYHLSYLLIANIFGMVGCYSLELATRGNFLRTGMLNDLADRDGLTGLHNRRAFESRAEIALAQAIRERVPVAIAMLDVDYFKAYNDVHGHLAGDHALTRVASMLAGYTRRPLDVVARYGGEEFVLLWFGANVAIVRGLAAHMRVSIGTMNIPHKAGSTGLLTISGGVIIVVPQPGQTLDDLLQQADLALYEAKRGGRDRFELREGQSQEPVGM